MLAAEQGAGDNTLDAYRRDLTDFSEFLARTGQNFVAPKPRRCATTSPISTAAASNRRAWRAGCRRCGICFVSCSTSGFAATIPPRSCRARSAAAACRRCCRSPTSIGCWCTPRQLADRAGSLCAAAASRACGLLPARSALRHGLAGIGTGGAAAVGGAARRPHDRGARQGQQGTAGAAEPGVATGDGRLPRGDGGAQAARSKKNAAASKWLFPSFGESGHLTRQHFARDLKELAAAAGLRAAAGQPACAAACVCQPSAAQRRRLAHRADAARPHRYLDHPDLHPCGRGAAEEPGARPASAGGESNFDARMP